MLVIVDTIGTIDDLIEKIQKKMNLLIKIGMNLYKKKIIVSYKEKPTNKLKIKYGVSLPNSKRNKGKYPLLASNGIVDSINQVNAKNAIVFGCRGTLGNVFYQANECYVLNTAFYINNPDNYGNLFFSLKSNDGLKLYSSGAAQPQITLDAIKNTTLKIPCDNQLNLILDLYSIYEQIMRKLMIQKSHLLSKYF